MRYSGDVPPSTVRRPRPALRVLLVDDEASIVDSLGRLLEFDGFHVDSAVDGETGLVLARSSSYDAILLDLELPGMSGLQVLQQLRLEGIRTPVVIMTRFASIESAFETGRIGAAGYLTKPIANTSEIAAALRRATAGVEPRLRRLPPLFWRQAARQSERSHNLLSNLARMWIAPESTGGDTAADPGRAEVLRDLCRTAADRRLTFVEFIVVAKAVRLLCSKPSPPLPVALRRIREWIQEASAHACSRMDARIERVLLHVEGAGKGWSQLTETNVAVTLGLDVFRLWQLLTEQLGLTFPKCRRAIVMRRAVLELSNTDEHVRQVAFLVGYKDAGNFDRNFREFFGVTPTEFRRLQQTPGWRAAAGRLAL